MTEGHDLRVAMLTLRPATPVEAAEEMATWEAIRGGRPIDAAEHRKVVEGLLRASAVRKMAHPLARR